MPTATYRQLYNWVEERGDLAFGRPPWAGEGGDAALLAKPYEERVGLNAYGLRSHATAPGCASANDGAGYLQSGVRYYGPRMIPEITVTCNPSEGNHEKTAGCVFQVGIKPGADGVPSSGVTSAVIRPKIRTSTPTVGGHSSLAAHGLSITKDGRDVFAAKIYGIAHDDFRAGRRTDGGTGYNQTYWNQWNARIPYRPFTSAPQRRQGHFAMRYYADSAPADMEHTEAVHRLEIPLVNNYWQGAPGWQSDDISDIVNEILLRPGWAAGNRLCLCLANDGTLNDITPDYVVNKEPHFYPADYYPLFAQSLGQPWLWWRFENDPVQCRLDFGAGSNTDANCDWELILTY